jgi:hypothetical protein
MLLTCADMPSCAFRRPALAAVLQEHKVWVEDPAHPEGGSWQYDYAITNVEYTGLYRGFYIGTLSGMVVKFTSLASAVKLPEPWCPNLPAQLSIAS